MSDHGAPRHGTFTLAPAGGGAGGSGLRFVERAAAFAVLWWVLSEGAASSWVFGVPFVLLAAVASLKLTPARGWNVRPAGALRFIGFFAYQSFIGGIDVAWRAIHPSMPIIPGFATYTLRLPTESARVLLADTVSLLPGTLSAAFEGDVLVMHVLDRTQPISEEVAAVEERIADALGLTLIERPSCAEGGGEA